MARVLAYASLALLLSSCATILTGTTDEVKFDSVPSNAKLTVKTDFNGTPVYNGATPATVELKRKHSYRAELELPGYEPVSVLIDTEFNGWTLLNIICGGIIGLAVDAVTGAFWWLDTEHVAVRLVAAPPAPPPGGVVDRENYRDGSDSALYAMFVGRDAGGELRGIAVPLLRKAP